MSLFCTPRTRQQKNREYGNVNGDLRSWWRRHANFGISVSASPVSLSERAGTIPHLSVEVCPEFLREVV